MHLVSYESLSSPFRRLSIGVPLKMCTWLRTIWSNHRVLLIPRNTLRFRIFIAYCICDALKASAYDGFNLSSTFNACKTPSPWKNFPNQIFWWGCIKTVSTLEKSRTLLMFFFLIPFVTIAATFVARIKSVPKGERELELCMKEKINMNKCFPRRSCKVH